MQLATATRPAIEFFNNVAPRIGFGWQIPHALVFRAGYGVYFNPEIALESYDLVKNSQLNEFNQTQGDRAPVLTTRDAFPKTAASGFPSFSAHLAARSGRTLRITVFIGWSIELASMANQEIFRSNTQLTNSRVGPGCLLK